MFQFLKIPQKSYSMYIPAIFLFAKFAMEYCYLLIIPDDIISWVHYFISWLRLQKRILSLGPIWLL